MYSSVFKEFISYAKAGGLFKAILSDSTPYIENVCLYSKFSLYGYINSLVQMKINIGDRFSSVYFYKKGCIMRKRQVALTTGRTAHFALINLA